MIETKVYDPKVVNRSVLEPEDVALGNQPTFHPLVFSVAVTADEITPWGVNPARRDKELREFWINEPWLASTVYGVSIRNASFSWEIIGSDPVKPRPTRTIAALTKILSNSDRGNGWENFMLKLSQDLYTQDNGAFVELIRKQNNPNSSVINIANLDAGACLRTGDPKFPVIYTDKNGKEHLMKYWQVIDLAEFPSAIEKMRNMQYSAVTRALLAAMILRDISIYKKEKVSGQFTRAIHAITNVTRGNIEDAMKLSQEQLFNQGLTKYSQPIIVPGLDPTNPISHVQIDLATLPDAFNEDTTLKWYIAQLALAFGVDYQEIAPMMTGNLGSSQQSEIMHLKTRGKGPALIMKLIERLVNTYVMPPNVKFQFKEHDLRSETEKAEARFVRAKERSLRLKSGEINIEMAQQIAIEDGDLSPWMIEKYGSIKTQNTEREFGADQILSGIDSAEERKTYFKSEIATLRKNLRSNSLASLVD